MKKIVYIATIVSILGSCFSTAEAQLGRGREIDRPYAYMGLTVGGGLGMITGSTDNGTRSAGTNFDLGVHYTHFFSRIGIGFAFHLSRVGANCLYSFEEQTPNLTHADNPNAHYTLITRYSDWKEHQSITVIDIPIEVFFRAPMGSGRSFVAGLGVMVEMPKSGKYRAGGGSFTTSGVFPALGTYEVGDMPEHGFTTYEEIPESPIRDLKTGFSVLADLGVRMPLGNGGGLYIGLYGSYGLTNLIGDHEAAPLLTLNTRTSTLIDYNGTFATAGGSSMRLVKIGVKVGIDLASPMDL